VSTLAARVLHVSPWPSDCLPYINNRPVMKKKPRIFAAISLIAANVAVQLCPAGQMPVSADAVQRAHYTCAKTSGSTDKAKAAAGLSIQTSDKNALACAADFRFEIAMAAPADLEARINALDSLARYIALVHSLKQFDLVQINWAEYNLRLEHASKLADTILPATQKIWPNEPASIILSAEIRSALAGPSDPQITLAAIAEVKRAIAIDPQALHGEGQLLIGRKYLELPPIFGGGAEQALIFLESARQIAPGDPCVLRYLAQAYDELDRRDEAVGALRALVEVAPINTDLQLSADEWRMGEGLATRFGDDALTAQFAARRSELMRQHPAILLRKVAAVFGHGGDDPMTGTPQYRGENTNTH
jgi:tetratricopeptide (TPR) repeat protein